MTTSNVHVYLDADCSTDNPWIIIGHEGKFRFTNIDNIDSELSILFKQGGWLRSQHEDSFGPYLGTLDQLPELLI